MKTLVTILLANVALISAVSAESFSGQVQNLMQKYTIAFNGKDARGVANLYSTDAVVVTQTGKTVMGRSNIEQAYSNIFQKLPFELSLSVDQIHESGNGGWAIGHGNQGFNGHHVPAHALFLYTRENGTLELQAISVGIDTSLGKGLPVD